MNSMSYLDRTTIIAGLGLWNVPSSQLSVRDWNQLAYAR